MTLAAIPFAFIACSFIRTTLFPILLCLFRELDFAYRRYQMPYAPYNLKQHQLVHFLFKSWNWGMMICSAPMTNATHPLVVTKVASFDMFDQTPAAIDTDDDSSLGGSSDSTPDEFSPYPIAASRTFQPPPDQLILRHLSQIVIAYSKNIFLSECILYRAKDLLTGVRPVNALCKSNPLVVTKVASFDTFDHTPSVVDTGGDSSLGVSRDSTPDEFSPCPVAAFSDIPAAARSVDYKTSITDCHRFFKEEAPKQLHPALHQKSTLQRSASQCSLKEEASSHQHPILHKESSLQRAAGVYVKGTFMPYAEPDASTTTDKDREHLSQLIQREINEIGVYNDNGVIMPFAETNASVAIDQDRAHRNFLANRDAKRASQDSNHMVRGFDESIYTTVLDLSTIPIEVQQRAEEIANAIENKSLG